MAAYKKRVSSLEDWQEETKARQAAPLPSDDPTALQTQLDENRVSGNNIKVFYSKLQNLYVTIGNRTSKIH